MLLSTFAFISFSNSAMDHLSGYYVEFFQNNLKFSSKSGQKYRFIISDYCSPGCNYSTDEAFVLYRQVDLFGLVWGKMDTLRAGYTWNDIHYGADLITSPDGKTLFVRRNTERSPIWSDVFDISVDPPQPIVQGLDCCSSSGIPTNEFSTTDEDLRKRSLEIVELARSTGVIVDASGMSQD